MRKGWSVCCVCMCTCDVRVHTCCVGPGLPGRETGLSTPGCWLPASPLICHRPADGPCWTRTTPESRIRDTEPLGSAWLSNRKRQELQ